MAKKTSSKSSGAERLHYGYALTGKLPTKVTTGGSPQPTPFAKGGHARKKS